jgi:hypothetical protein
MAITRSVRSLALLATWVLSAACATSRYTQSQIEALPPGVKGKGGSRASLEIEGLKLAVHVLDRTPEQESVRSLTLRIVFDPRELGYSFDPGQVVLRAADGREWRATAGQYLPLYPEATFELAFDVAVEAETGVELVLDGLARGPKRLEPVTLPLARRPGRSIDRVYWLEVIGYAMAVLTYPYGGM